MNYAESGMEEGDESFPLSVSKDRIKISTPKDVLPLCEWIVGAEKECVMMFCLDGNNQVASRHMVTVGLANQSQIHPREVFINAVRNNAVSILVVHNHPSGNLEPSEADLIATRRLVECSKTLGIPVLDHLIISIKGFTSLRERYPAYFG
jgi:DNA repair protein RadC